MDNFTIWLTDKSFPRDTEMKWGFDPSATAQTIADKYTAPTGITWNTLGSEPLNPNVGELSVSETPQTKLKKTKLKDTKEIAFPGWINIETWNSFIEMRTRMKASPTVRAKELLINELEKLKLSGQDPNLVLEQSIMNNWKGVFPIKDPNGGNHATNKRTSSRELPTKYTTPEELQRQQQPIE